MGKAWPWDGEEPLTLCPQSGIQREMRVLTAQDPHLQSGAAHA